MAKLRGFDDNSFLDVENVFLAKQVDPARPACELTIKEGVVIRTPADLGHVKVTRNAQLGTHMLQIVPPPDVPGAAGSDAAPVNIDQSGDRWSWPSPTA